MRNFWTGLTSLALISSAGTALASEAPSRAEENARYLESLLRAEAARQGVELPDFATATAEKIEYDTQTGLVTQTQVPLNQHLLEVASVLGSASLADTGTQAGLVPTLGVGDNIHAYASLRVGQCNAKGYYTGWRTAQTVPGYVVPNPAFPVVPVAAAIVWGGPAFHVKGGGWLLGAHIFMGSPIDVNVNTEGSTAGVPVSPFLSLGLDSQIDSLAVGQMGMSSTAIRLFGICLGSIDLGYILENGMLAVNGEVIPNNPAGL